jgi:CcmD family protein
MGGRMKNLDSLFAAYMAAWAIFFVYYLTVAQRASALRRDIDRMKNFRSQAK